VEVDGLILIVKEISLLKVIKRVELIPFHLLPQQLNIKDLHNLHLIKAKLIMELNDSKQKDITPIKAEDLINHMLKLMESQYKIIKVNQVNINPK